MSVIKPVLLVVDDDLRLRKLLQKFLQKHSFEVIIAASSSEAEEVLANHSIDLMVLDVMMPGESGLLLCQRLRKTSTLPYCNIPILMLTARSEVNYRIEGLECGADDYLSKPFESRELILRIENILKRQTTTSFKKINDIILGQRRFDQQNLILYHLNEIVHLTSVEQNLMQVFSVNPKIPLSREELVKCCGVTLSPRTIDVQITRLRKKIEVDPKQPFYLRTIRHKGYALWPDS